jgi:hypothetical protein
MIEILKPNNCTVCKSKMDIPIEFLNVSYSILCPRCGDFLLTSTLFRKLQNPNNDMGDDWRWILSHYIRKNYNGEDKIEIDSDKFKEILKEDLPDGAQQSKILLKYLGDNIKHPPDNVSIDTRPLTAIMGAVHIGDVDYISEYLVNLNLITFQIPGQGHIDRYYGLTMLGWQEYKKLKKNQSGKPSGNKGNRIKSSGKRLNVFLCHASEDKKIILELYSQLREDNFDPWLDEEDILPGQEWKNEIEKAVRACDIVLVCLSNKSISKTGFVQREIKIALDITDEQPENTIFLIPLKLEECTIPDRIKKWQWVEYYKTGGYQKLIKALNHRANSL